LKIEHSLTPIHNSGFLPAFYFIIHLIR